MTSTLPTLVIKVEKQDGNDQYQTRSVVSDLDTASFFQQDEGSAEIRNAPSDEERSSLVSGKALSNSEFAFRYKLRSTRLKGRENEIKLLQEAFDRLRCKPPSRTEGEEGSELVLLSGPAGSGKSSLVKTALRNYVADRDGWFVSGKFDQHTNCVPFSAFTEALTDLTELLLQQDDGFALKRRLAASLRKNPREVQVLKYLMPNIAMILDDVVDEEGLMQYPAPQEQAKEAKVGDQSEKPPAATTAPSLNQLKTALRSFLHVVASREQPISIFIDDLQFADLESLDLIQAILSDEKSRYLLLICSYRDDEFDAASQFEFGQAACFQTQNIVAQCLSVPTIDQIIQELVGAAVPDKTRPLAEVVFRKTLGNAYDVLDFLEQLYRKNLLYLAEDGMGWQWDLGSIQKATDVSDNVAHSLIQDKVGELPATSRMVLQVAAACIGHKFLVCFLEELMTTTGMTSAVYYRAIQAAMDDGVIESCEAQDHHSGNKDRHPTGNATTRWIKFTHDKVQQAVADMAAEDSAFCKQLHLRVGRFSLRFRKRSSMQSFAEMFLFLALLNLSKCLDLVRDDGEKLEFVRLSLEAGKLSSSRCAFAQAASYVRKATSVLPQDVLWSPENRGLALDLYSFLAEMEMLVRRHDRCRETLQTIYSQTTDSIDDRLKAFVVEVENLGSEGKLSEAIRTARSHIRVLGERFPAKITILQMVSDLIRTKCRLSLLSDQYILSRPLMTDTRTKTVVVLISKIISCAQWLATEENTLLTCGLRLVRLTLDHGITSDGLSGLALYSIVEAAMGNYGVSRRFENLVNNSFWHRSDTRQLLNCTTRAGLGFMTTHLWKPLEECAVDMESFAVMGLNGIDLNESSTAIFGGWSTRVLCKPWTLPSLSREMESLQKEAISLGILRRELIASTPPRQYCLNLQGEASEPTRLEGTGMDTMRSLEPDQSMLDSLNVWVVIFQIYLSYQFEDWDYLQEHLVPAEKTMSKLVGTKVQLYQTLLVFAMSGLQLYEQCKNRRFLSLAKRCRKTLQRLQKHGSPNANAPLLLVNAEYTRIKHGSKLSDQQIEEGYERALPETRKSSWFAEFICYHRLLQHYCSCGNQPKARYYFDLLLDDVCDPWGATALAEHVSRKFESLGD